MWQEFHGADLREADLFQPPPANHRFQISELQEYQI